MHEYRYRIVRFYLFVKREKVVTRIKYCGYSIDERFSSSKLITADSHRIDPCRESSGQEWIPD